MPFLVALALGLVLVPAARWAGAALGLVDRPGADLKIHGGEVSVLGGVAVMAALFAALAVLGEPVPPPVMGAVAVSLAAGLVDDIRPLSWWARATVQASAGLVLVAGGMTLVAPGAAGAVALVAVVVACANAVNLTDGQDGLAGGVAAVAALALALVGRSVGIAEVDPPAMALAGALTGFVAWNLSPARVFLGNGGAYAVGTVLAVLAARVVAGLGATGLLVAGLCLGVFVFELVFTVSRRLGARMPITGGDRLHSYDLMAALLRGRTSSTLLYWGFGILAGGVGLVAATLPPAGAVAVASGSALAGVTAGLLLWRRRSRAALGE